MSDRFLLFRAAGTGFALPLKQVAEVRELPCLYPVPRLPEHLLGVMNSHGNLTALLDLNRFLGGGGVAGEGKVLVLDEKLAALALWVDEVMAIVPAEAVSEPFAEEGPYCAERMDTEFGSVGLLKVEELLETVERQLTIDN